MLILFLCGSLEPGRDGVGDYTRRLAGEIVRQGHEAMIIALHDRHVNEPKTNDRADVRETRGLSDALNALLAARSNDFHVRCCTQDADGTPVPVIRIASSLPWRLRRLVVEDAARQFAADWVSLQFVPYAFHAKGLPFQLVWMLKGLKRKIALKWHIMFHELWCGLEQQAKLKHRVVGMIQKTIIVLIYRILAQPLVNTSSRSYKQLLDTIEITSEQLQLFSNIPFLHSPINKALDTMIATAKDELLSQEKTAVFVLSTFGSWKRNWLYNEIFDKLDMLLSKNQFGAVVIAIGLFKPPEWFYEINHRITSLRFLFPGHLDPESIDSIINHSNAGILTTTVESLEKSGSALAFIERGKCIFTFYDGEPEVMQADDFHLVRNLNSSLGLSELQQELDINYTNRLEHVCKKFLTTLTSKAKIIKRFNN